MPVRHFQDLVAWQLATEFKHEAFRLLQGSPEAWRNQKYRHQVIDAAGSVASNVAEGFLRMSPGDFCRFLDYSVSSLVETEGRINDGVALNYFAKDSCSQLFRLGRRCLTAIVRLKQSQRRYMQERMDQRPRRSRDPKESRKKDDER